MAKAKKVRRARSTSAEQASSETSNDGSATRVSRRRSAKTADSPKKLSATEQFQQEYAYVLRDLRLVFILAGLMFALLIILNLLLR